MVIDRLGRIGLIDFFVPRLIGIIAPIRPEDVGPTLRDLASKVPAAAWISSWRGTMPVDPLKTVQALANDQHLLIRELDGDMELLRTALSKAIDNDGSL